MGCRTSLLKPCHSRRSSLTSDVSSVALRTILAAATIQSGNLCRTLRRRAIVSFFISSVRSIMEILLVRKITALVSSTKRLLIIPLVPKASLVSYAVAISVRGKNAEIRRNRLSAWRGGLHLMSRSWRKGNNSPSHRYFAGHVNGQPMAGRYFNRLLDGHKASVT